MRRRVQNEKRYGVGGRRITEGRRAAVDMLQPRTSLLIVCEGAITEPGYFRAFKVTNEIYGVRRETIRVVERAEKLNAQRGPFDQIWCVFDRDSFPASDFDNAIHMIRSKADKGFRAAYSNEAFELWFILHFKFQSAALDRSTYSTRLSDYLGRQYRKSDPDMYRLLSEMGDESLAIKRADQLRVYHGEQVPFSERNPVTTVDVLVQELRRLQRERRIAH